MTTGSANTTAMGALGLWSFELRGGDAALVANAAAELDAQGWGTVWIPGTTGRGIWDDAETLLAASAAMAVALGVVGIWSQDAEAATGEHASLVRAFGPRLVAGFGVSSPQSAVAAGKNFGTPLGAMNDYLDQVDADKSPIDVGNRILGALGPKMVALAGARAAGIHPFLVTPESNAVNRAILGPDALIAPHQAVVLEVDPEKARAIARRGIGNFIGFPSYQANLRRLGFGDDDLVPGGSDRLIDATVAWGSIDDIARRLQQHWDAGADHIALHTLTAQRGLPLEEWRELSALRETRPGD